VGGDVKRSSRMSNVPNRPTVTNRICSLLASEEPRLRAEAFKPKNAVLGCKSTLLSFSLSLAAGLCCYYLLNFLLYCL